MMEMRAHTQPGCDALHSELTSDTRRLHYRQGMARVLRPPSTSIVATDSTPLVRAGGDQDNNRAWSAIRCPVRREPCCYEAA